MDPRQCAEISTYLRQLAAALDHPTAGHARRIADQLRELANRRLVALPAIDPARDDLQHWTELSDHRLGCENQADAWSLAAGLYVQADRATWGQLTHRDAT